MTAAALLEQPATKGVLIDTFGPVKMALVEGATGGKLVMEGKVGHCDQATANGRVYTRAVMEREVNRLQERIKQRSLLAAVDHPGDGKSRLREAGAICTGLRIEPNGEVIGRYEVVEDSTCGRDLAAFLRAGAAVGMSSRGIGSTRLDVGGRQVVGEDFKLYGYDFVSDPACVTAYPKLVGEDVDTAKITAEAIRQQFPLQILQLEEHARNQAAALLAEAAQEERSLHEQQLRLELTESVRKELSEDFSVKLVRAIERQKADVTAVVRSEMLSDPQVAGAKRTLDEISKLLNPYTTTSDPRPALVDNAQSVQTEAAKQESTELRTQIEALSAKLGATEQAAAEAANKARNYGYALFVERSISGRPDVDAIRAMIGNDFSGFSTFESLQEKLRATLQAADQALESAQTQAATHTSIERHKAEVAKEEAKVAVEDVHNVRAEVAKQIKLVTSRFESVLNEREALIEQAAAKIDLLERQLNEQSTQVSDAAFDRLLALSDRRTLGHPKRDQIMAQVEARKLTTFEAVNQLAESLEQRAEEPAGPAERIRRSLGRGREAPTETQRLEGERSSTMTEQASGATSGDLRAAGVSMAEIKQLARVGQKTKGRRFL